MGVAKGGGCKSPSLKDTEALEYIVIYLLSPTYPYSEKVSEKEEKQNPG